MTRKIIVSLILVAACLSLGGGTAYWLISNAKLAPTGEFEQKPLLVEVVRVEPQTIVEPIVGHGTAKADRYARISSQVAGEIVEIPKRIKEGAFVEADELLVRIDDRDYQAALEQAKSMLAEIAALRTQLATQEENLTRLVATARRQFESAEWNYERVRRLHGEGNAPEAEFEQAKSQYEQARLSLQQLESELNLLPDKRPELDAREQNYQANLKLALLNTERCRIKAPFSGIIDMLGVELGEMVGPGVPLLSILNDELIVVPIELAASLRTRVKVGAFCTLTMSSLPDVAWKGRVKRIGASVNQVMRTFQLYVEVENEDQQTPLVPGYFLTARIDGPTIKDAMVVPRGIVQNDRVFVYEDGKALERKVQVERQLANRSVVSGLLPGDVVITTNLDVLYEGAPVRFNPESEGAVESATSQPTAHLLTSKR